MPVDLEDQEDERWLFFTLVAGVIVVAATVGPGRVLGRYTDKDEDEDEDEDEMDFDNKVRRATWYIPLQSLDVLY